MSDVGPVEAIERVEHAIAFMAIAAEELGVAAVSELWSRGHACGGWELLPRIFRDGLAPQEAQLAEHFRLRAPAYMEHGERAHTTIEWLSIAQHHGLPTRLLDWSSSSLVALFFAVTERDHAEEDGMLVVLSPARLADVQLKEARLAASYENTHGALPASSRLVASVAEAALDLKTDGPILPVCPALVTRRLAVQHSSFTLHGNTTPMDQHARRAEFLRACPVAASSKRIIQGQLASMGVTLEALFPDLDHLAQRLLADVATSMDAPDIEARPGRGPVL